MFDPSPPRPVKTGWIIAGAILAPIVVGAIVLGLGYRYVRGLVDDRRPGHVASDCEKATGFPGLEEIVANSPLEIAEMGDWQATLVHRPTSRTLELNALDWCNGYGPKPGSLTHEDTGEPIPGIHLRGTATGLPAWFPIPSSWAVDSSELAADGRLGMVMFGTRPGPGEIPRLARSDLEAALRATWGSVQIDGDAFVSPDGRKRIVVREVGRRSSEVNCLFRESE